MWNLQRHVLYYDFLMFMMPNWYNVCLCSFNEFESLACGHTAEHPHDLRSAPLFPNLFPCRQECALFTKGTCKSFIVGLSGLMLAPIHKNEFLHNMWKDGDNIISHLLFLAISFLEKLIGLLMQEKRYWNTPLTAQWTFGVPALKNMVASKKKLRRFTHDNNPHNNNKV